jgi:hypothetical protein
MDRTDRGNVHVTPCHDMIEHELTDDCACGPTTEPVTAEDGSVGWLLIHHSLDGRERTEPASTRPSPH